MNKIKYIILTVAICFFLTFFVFPLRTFAVTEYRCFNTGCAISAGGSYTTSNCDGKCVGHCLGNSADPCQYTDSNTDTPTCTSDSDCDNGGTTDDITDDEPEQATTTRYHCDSQNRKCIEDPQGIYPSLSACTDICYRTPAMDNRYRCDRSVQKCYEHDGGPYQGLARCLEDCIKPKYEIIPRYACEPICSKDPITKLTSCEYACVEDVQGSYSPLSNCEIGCQKTGWVGIECPGNDYCYKCDKAALRCYQTKEGNISSLHWCQDVYCADPCIRNYSCDRSTKKCYKVDSGSGGFSSLSSCERECVKIPNWECRSGGACYFRYIDLAQQRQEFSSGEECKYECPEMERTQDGRWIKYKCSTSTGKCYQNVLTGVGYWTRRTCEANCPPKYSCDPSTLKCIEDPNGKYSNLTECGKDCKPRYSCDTSTWTCYLDPNGYFTTKNQCEFRCTKPLTAPNVPRYSCDKSTRTCFVDTPHGAWSPLSNCEYLCQQPGSTKRCPGNPSCFACNLTTCQCYQTTLGKFGQLHQCLEYACTPERCAAGTTPGVSTPCRSCSGGVAACTGTPSSQVAPSEDTTPPVPSSQVAPSEDTTPPVNGFMVPPSTQPSVTTGGCGASPSTEAPPAGDPWNLEYWIKFWTK